jgi:hypothetical protein
MEMRFLGWVGFRQQEMGKEEGREETGKKAPCLQAMPSVTLARHLLLVVGGR